MDSTPFLLTKYAGKLNLRAEDGDYMPIKGFHQWKSVFWLETLNLWMIGFPITLTMICQFGVGSVTNMFVGHLGDVELSAVTIATSVIGTFSFGFLVSICLLRFDRINVWYSICLSDNFQTLYFDSISALHAFAIARLNF